jgi:hypothetical protein
MGWAIVLLLHPSYGAGEDWNGTLADAMRTVSKLHPLSGAGEDLNERTNKRTNNKQKPEYSKLTCYTLVRFRFLVTPVLWGG